MGRTFRPPWCQLSVIKWLQRSIVIGVQIDIVHHFPLSLASKSLFKSQDRKFKNPQGSRMKMSICVCVCQHLGVVWDTSQVVVAQIWHVVRLYLNMGPRIIRGSHHLPLVELPLGLYSAFQETPELP